MFSAVLLSVLTAMRDTCMEKLELTLTHPADG
jgi:hypothetical protein